MRAGYAHSHSAAHIFATSVRISKNIMSIPSVGRGSNNHNTQHTGSKTCCARPPALQWGLAAGTGTHAINHMLWCSALPGNVGGIGTMVKTRGADVAKQGPSETVARRHPRRQHADALQDVDTLVSMQVHVCAASFLPAAAASMLKGGKV